MLVLVGQPGDRNPATAVSPGGTVLSPAPIKADGNSIFLTNDCSNLFIFYIRYQFYRSADSPRVS